MPLPSARVMLLLTGVWLAGCGHMVVDPIPDPAHTTGTVTQVPSAFGGYAFLIEEHPDRPHEGGAGPFEAGDKYHVGVDAATRIERRTAGGGLVPATLADVAVGTRAEVWFVGPILESYPAQGAAGRIRIIDP